MVVDYTARISKFMSRVLNNMVKQCRTTMLVKEMDLSRLIVHAQQIEKEKLKKKKRNNKKARAGSFNFSQPRSEGVNRSQFC